MSFTVQVFGAPRVGKHTFISALQLTNAAPDSRTDQPDQCTVELNDARSAKQLLLHFHICEHSQASHAAIFMYHDQYSFHWLENRVQNCAATVKVLVQNKCDL
jgi:hypothetical protein